MTVAYVLCALANALVAITAGADAAHFAEAHEHGHGEGTRRGPPASTSTIPAVGLGGPIDRTLWTLIWGVVAMIFQAMGITYMLGHEVCMPQIFRDAIDFVSGPTTFFVGATLGFIATIRYRRFVANGLVGWGIVNLFLLFFGLSMTDYDFRDIVTKPDNVPIVGLMILVGFFTWVGLRRAVINDARMAQGLPNLEELEPEKTLTWPDLVYTELIAMVVQTIFLVVWGIVLQAPLEQPASSTVAPNPSKAPWYFLGLQEMLVYFDPWMAGVVLPSMIIVGLMAMPYIDTNKAGNGYFTLRRAQVRLHHVPVRLPRALGRPDPPGHVPPRAELELLRPVRILGPAQADPAEQREPLGHLLGRAPGQGQADEHPAPRAAGDRCSCLAYFTLVPYLMYRLFFKKYVEQAGMLRSSTLAVLLLFMASLPIKMVLRWTINLKYLVAIPEYFFNI